MFSHIKFLGVIVDNNLSWAYHIKEITSKMAKSTYQLARIKKCLFRYKLQWYPIISYTLIFFILRYYGTPSCQSPSYFFI